tara:strand:- start:894 stop:1841 length:948 start_codon:yes stop_codon:yes gene_type:complete
MRILYEQNYDHVGCVQSHAYELFPRVGYIPILKNAHLACIDHWTNIYSSETTLPDKEGGKLDGGLHLTRVNCFGYHFSDRQWVCWNDWPALSENLLNGNPQYRIDVVKEYAIADGIKEDLDDPKNIKLFQHYSRMLQDKTHEHKPFTHLFTILRNPYDRYISASWEAYKSKVQRTPISAKEIIDFCDIEWKHDNYVFDIHQEPQHKFLNSFLNQDVPLLYFNMTESVFDDIESYFKDKINKKKWHTPLSGLQSHRTDPSIIQGIRDYLFTKPSFHEYMNWEYSELMKTVSYMKPGMEPDGWPITQPSGVKFHLNK